ncbi:protein Churchill-like [Anneissia japonica]|uniref:protein Churchill-like n=1 Tax=Anneissia japonica TaxID=1529436 RepID=UPI0014259FA6|nr:protein Churchill-like [Anneissia japonica]
MCIDCTKENYPDRGETCLDSGSYMINFQCCKECNKKEPIKLQGRTVETDEDDVETISYQHVCGACGHLIAKHSYTFCVDGEYQEYEMICLLCGRSATSVSVLPDDPRLQTVQF